MIHSSAVVSKDAEIHETTNIGPFCIIGDGVKIGKNNNLLSHVSIIGDTSRRIFGMQFHPEVFHTVNGKKFLENFVNISNIKKNCYKCY